MPIEIDLSVLEDTAFFSQILNNHNLKHGKTCDIKQGLEDEISGDPAEAEKTALALFDGVGPCLRGERIADTESYKRVDLITGGKDSQDGTTRVFLIECKLNVKTPRHCFYDRSAFCENVADKFDVTQRWNIIGKTSNFVLFPSALLDVAISHFNRLLKSLDSDESFDKTFELCSLETFRKNFRPNEEQE